MDDAMRKSENALSTKEEGVRKTHARAAENLPRGEHDSQLALPKEVREEIEITQKMDDNLAPITTKRAAKQPPHTPQPDQTNPTEHPTNRK